MTVDNDSKNIESARRVARPAGTGERADSRATILAAAAVEFAARGFAGVRMEHVAKRAGYNKALVYKHFGDRDGLFDAVLDSEFAARRKVLEDLPDDLGQALAAWSDATFAHPEFAGLIMREALDRPEVEPIRAEERRAYYRAQITSVAEAQRRGKYPPHLEPRYLFLAMLAVVTLPAFLPQITALATGEDPSGEAFQKGWRKFLEKFACALAGDAGREDGDEGS